MRSNGLLYANGETLFGIGVFRKTLESPTWHVMVSGPWGANGFAKVDAFISRLRRLGVGADVFVRHLDEAEYAVFRRHGYLDIHVSPWDPEAPAEDETHNPKRIPLA